MVRMTALLLPVLVLGFAVPAEARTLHVHKGQSIQAAVDRAKPGDRILVGPGVYREEGKPCPAASAQTCAVAIQKNGIKLIGQGSRKHPVVLRVTPGAGRRDRGGEGVSEWRLPLGRVAAAARIADPRTHRARLRRLRSVPDRAWTTGGSHACARSTTASTARSRRTRRSDGWTTRSRAARTTPATTSGSRPRAGGPQRRQGQRERLRAREQLADPRRPQPREGNTAASCRSPFRASTSRRTPTTGSTTTARSRTTRRTRASTERHGCAVPPGPGILLVADHRNRVGSNKVKGNNSLGIAVANYCVALERVPEPTARPSTSSRTRTEPGSGNTASQKGRTPTPPVPSVFAVDLAWDITGSDNCWSGNKAGHDLPVAAAGLTSERLGTYFHAARRARSHYDRRSCGCGFSLPLSSVLGAVWALSRTRRGH